MTEKISILDKGYVRLVDVMGSDITVANAARVSFNKSSRLNEDGSLKERDEKLIKFLWENEHTAPFRHATLTFEINAPLMVARQHWKHHVASTYVDDQNGWNEMSKRYVTEEPEFYIPKETEWRSSPDNKKQGSGDPISAKSTNENPLGGEFFSALLEQFTYTSQKYYELAIEAGIAVEQARLFLPAYGMYVKYYWTVSLHGLMNFLALRLPKDAQLEIQNYAKAIRDLAETKFPASLRVMDS